MQSYKFKAEQRKDGLWHVIDSEVPGLVILTHSLEELKAIAEDVVPDMIRLSKTLNPASRYHFRILLRDVWQRNIAIS